MSKIHEITTKLQIQNKKCSFLQERQRDVAFAACEGHRPVLDADHRLLEVLVAQNQFVTCVVTRFHFFEDAKGVAQGSFERAVHFIKSLA